MNWNCFQALKEQRKVWRADYWGILLQPKVLSERAPSLLSNSWKGTDLSKVLWVANSVESVLPSILSMEVTLNDLWVAMMVVMSDGPSDEMTVVSIEMLIVTLAYYLVDLLADYRVDLMVEMSAVLLADY